MSITAKAQLAGAALGLAGQVASERVRRGPAPTTLSEVPASAEDLTPPWLTAALCRRHPGAKVVDVSLRGGSNGSTSRRGITLTYNDVGREAELPTQIFTKSTPSLTSRLVVGPTGLLASESAFYTTVRPTLDIEVAQGYYTTVDQRSYRSMFLLEDVGVTRGAKFGDPSSMPVSKKMAESQVDLLAGLHGGTWDSPLFATRPGWLRNVQDMMVSINALANFKTGALGAGIKRSADVLPAELLRHRDRLWPSYMRSLELNTVAPMSLLHNDVHLGNWYRAEDGTMGLYDWQTFAQGFWAKDFAYALGSALTIDDRRAWEQELLERYLARLADDGGPKLTFEQGWLAYRQQTFHGFFFWLFTIGAGRLQPDMQPRHISLENLSRMGQQVVDLESVAAIDA